MTLLPLRGELWWCETPDIGRRPGLVLTRDTAIPLLRRTLVVFASTRIRGLASEVVLEPGDDPVTQRCALALDVPTTLSVGHLVERMGRLSDERMHEVCAALRVAIDCR